MRSAMLNLKGYYWGFIQVIIKSHPFINFIYSMKEILILFTVLVSFINPKEYNMNTLKGIYTFESVTDDLDCNIYFFENGNYYIELQGLVTTGIIESFVFSYGSYTLKNSQITLKEKIFEYIMIGILNEDNKGITITNGFKWLLNKKFKFYSDHIGNEPIYDLGINALTIEKQRLAYNDIITNFIPLSYGWYENEQGFKLNIKSGGGYELIIKNVLFSEGDWCREKNEIHLYDRTFKSSFFMLIDNYKILSMLLPGDYRGLYLYKK